MDVITATGAEALEMLAKRFPSFTWPRPKARRMLTV